MNRVRARLSVCALAALGALACALGAGLRHQPDDRAPAAAAPHSSVRPVDDRAPSAPRFERWDVFIDSGTLSLAAYQVEVRASGASIGRVTIAGVEGGDARTIDGQSSAFNSAPYYDPHAMQGDTVIIGALAAGTPPSGRTRVAAVHVMVKPGTPPTELAVRLMTAGAPAGDKIDATATVEKAR